MPVKKNAECLLSCMCVCAFVYLKMSFKNIKYKWPVSISGLLCGFMGRVQDKLTNL